MTRNALLVLLVLLSGSCAGARGAKVDLSGNWPARTSDFDEVTSRWTRVGYLTEKLPRPHQVLEVYATLKSPDWRSAYTEFMTRQSKLPAEERQKLLDKMKKEESEFYEVELMVAVDDRRSNNLHQGQRSAWRLSLVDDDGQEIEPTSVIKDRRPRTVVQAEFPHLSNFHTAYVVKFPKTVPLFGPDARQVAFKMGNQRGAVELFWEAAR